MKKSELVKLKKLLKYEEERRNRVNELLSNNLIKEFLSLNFTYVPALFVFGIGILLGIVSP